MIDVCFSKYDLPNKIEILYFIEPAWQLGKSPNVGVPAYMFH